MKDLKNKDAKIFIASNTFHRRIFKEKTRERLEKGG